MIPWQPVPKARTGVNALREAIYAAVGVDRFGPETENRQENRFSRLATELLAGG